MKKKDKKAQKAQAEARIEEIESELKELDRLEEGDGCGWKIDHIVFRQKLINEKEELTRELSGYNSLQGKKPWIRKTTKNAIHKEEELDSYEKELFQVEYTLRNDLNKGIYAGQTHECSNVVAQT